MDLQTYVSDIGRRKKLAKAVKRNPDYLRQVAAGYRLAGAKLCLSIEQATDGLVKRHELRPDLFGGLKR
jgi:DNA-binding transcriptional regulator YdaS (Cro superfamily)